MLFFARLILNSRLALIRTFFTFNFSRLDFQALFTVNHLHR